VAPNARVAELADALDLGSSPLNGGWGFKSPLSQWILSSSDEEKLSVKIFMEDPFPFFSSSLIITLITP
jgi:hypothetical protein